ncbi:hypothetical protein CPG38_13090 [Malaciobacter marinus]|uniref:restriction endonuclease n=1 Tax=Malaciobacter marinus TaxID=505249 RepID=UPI000C069AAD|nr:restriction endonuclease [Malaciobacter marinus]PHO11425.1 hypothetical protein CPG38_13090 [Malaciobacter marinus]
MKISKPLLEEYSLSIEELEKYKKQTLNLDDILNKSYLAYLGLIIAIIYWLYNDALLFISSNIPLGIFGIFIILPISVGFFTLCLVILISIISTFLKFYHPLTKNIESFTKDLNEYNIKLKKYEEEQEKLKIFFWYSLTGHQFEYEVAKLFKQFGFKVEVTKGSDDKGVDINMWQNNKYIVVQCKAHKKRLSPAISRELYGTMKAHNATEAYLITLEGISDKSHEFIDDKPIKVFDVNSLISMQKKLTSHE